MSNIKFWGWDKKPRTMRRFVKPGDIFCFHVDDEHYLFGRIMTKIITGHVAEIFNFISTTPEITEEKIYNAKRIISPIVIDTYSLFDRKEENSDWRIIGHQNDYMPNNVENIYFTYGIGNSCKKVDVFGNETPICETEAEKIPWLSPLGDFDVKEILLNKLKIDDCRNQR